MPNRGTPLDRKALRVACTEVARSVMWDQRPVDIETIDAVAEELFAIALKSASFIDEHRDPNLVVRAVQHLGHSHAIPPMRADTSWFKDMLAAIVELANPTEISLPLIRFLNDIMVGAAEARMKWDAEASTDEKT